MGKGRLQFALAVAVLATPVASWWLIGDQSESRLEPRQRDYVVRAPEVAHWIVVAAGVVAVLALVTSIGALARAVTQRRMDRRWFGVLALLMVAGVLVAYSGRIATAGVDGANIGFGLCVIFGAPALVAVVGAAAGLSTAIRRTHASAR